MIKAQMKDPKGNVVCEITLPATPSELPLANYVSFLTEAAKYGIPGQNLIRVMAKAVAEFSGQPIETILSAQLGDGWQDSDAPVEGIAAMYGWCMNVIGKWQGNFREYGNFEFQHKGQTFHIPTITTQAIGGASLPDIDVNEAIEAFETVRMFSDRIQAGATVRECVSVLQMVFDEKKRESYEKQLMTLIPESKSMDLKDFDVLETILEKHGDQDGNMSYSRYLMMMAIICRKPGEKLPENEKAKRAFINERAILFQDIDTQTALDVDFFLQITFKAYGMTLPVIGSLIRPALGHVVEMKSWKGRLIPGPSSKTKLFTNVLGGKR